jgi:hypothetical protein
MARIPSGDPDILIYRSGGGCLALFGLPVLLLGLLSLTSPIWNPKAPEDRVPAVVFSLLLGLPFTAAGAVLLLGRAGKLLDRRVRSLTAWWGALGWRRERRYSLDDFDTVWISRKLRGSRKHPHTEYPVRVKGGKSLVTIEEYREYRPARRTAEDLARFLQCRIVDAAGDREVVREPDTLDQSLRDRARRKGWKVEVPDRPDGARTRREDRGRTGRFHVPSPGLQKPHYIQLAMGISVPLATGGLFVLFMVGDEDPPNAWKWLLLGFLAAVFIIYYPYIQVGGALRSATRRATVDVSPELLKVVETGFLLNRTTEIPAGELEELRVESADAIRADRDLTVRDQSGRTNLRLASGRVIYACSDSSTVTFGQGLDDDELKWLQASIEEIITS